MRDHRDRDRDLDRQRDEQRARLFRALDACHDESPAAIRAAAVLDVLDFERVVARCWG